MLSRAIALVTVAVLSIGLVACTSEPEPVPEPTATATPLPPSGDGVLRFGTLFPVTGEFAFMGSAQLAGVELAVRELNEFGGVNGKPVEVFHRDSADASSELAEASFGELAGKGVDVVIGPSVSVLAERVLPLAVEAGIPLISPAATDPRLSAHAETGMFFRTIPSAALQGAAIAGLIKGTVAVIYFDDEPSLAVRDSLVNSSPTDAVVADVKMTASASPAKIVSEVKAAKPNAVVLASPFSQAEQNQAVIAALTAARLGGEKLWLTSQSLADYSQTLPAGVLDSVGSLREGAEPDDAFITRVRASDPRVTDFRYAAEAYDATILAALAAVLANDDGGPSIAASLRDASSGGISCTSYGECLDVLITEDDIDYDGVSGPLELDASGDPMMAHYSLFRYGPDNKYARYDGVLAG